MSNNQATYHHLYSRTSMKQWSLNETGVYVMDRVTNKNTPDLRNMEKICGIDDYHTIAANSYLVSKKSLKQFFYPLKDYEIFLLEEEVEKNNFVSDLYEINDAFDTYDHWVLKHKVTGDFASDETKKALKEEVLSKKFLKIEKQWNKKFETPWNALLESIVKKVKPTSESISATQDQLKKLIEFMVMTKWRTLPYPKEFQYLIDQDKKTHTFPYIDYKGVDLTKVNLDEDNFSPQEIKLLSYIKAQPVKVDLTKIKIPEGAGAPDFLENILDEHYHTKLLLMFKQFQLQEGPLMKEVNNIFNNYQAFLFTAPAGKEFITSDNPVIDYTDLKNKKHIYFFPITPKLAVLFKEGKKNNGFDVIKLNNKRLHMFNGYTKDNCHELYIMTGEDLSLYFKKDGEEE